MNSSTLQHITALMQDAKDGKVTKDGFNRTKLLHRIIREHGKPDGTNYSVDLADISIDDRAELLSYILENYDYRWAIKSDARINNMFNENADYISELIDMELSEVYQEDMEEMGMCLRHFSDNGEQYLARR